MRAEQQSSTRHYPSTLGQARQTKGNKEPFILCVNSRAPTGGKEHNVA